MKFGETTEIRVSAPRRLDDARYVGPFEAFGDVGAEVNRRHRVSGGMRKLRQLQTATEKGFYKAMVRTAVAIVATELFGGIILLMVAVLVLMVTEMMSGLSGFVLTIDTHPGPTELEGNNDEKEY